jgi:hypothetical protein
VKEEMIASHQSSVAPDCLDQTVIVPFMDQDQVGTIELAIEVQGLEGVLETLQRGVSPVKSCDSALTMLQKEMLATPGCCRLQYSYPVTASLQLAGDATQEVGIAVIPIGNQRVIKHHDTHADSLA